MQAAALLYSHSSDAGSPGRGTHCLLRCVLSKSPWGWQGISPFCTVRFRDAGLISLFPQGISPEGQLISEGFSLWDSEPSASIFSSLG